MHVSSDPKYWDAVNEKFYTKYNGLDAKHKEWAQKVINNEPIVSPLGREWPIQMTKDLRGNSKIPWTVLSNYPVQGTGADVMMIARITFAKRLKLLEHLSSTTKLISSVHDSIVVDAPSEYLQEITNLFHQVFDDLQLNIKRAFKYDWQVPLACEVKAGNNMKDMRKVERTDL